MFWLLILRYIETMQNRSSDNCSCGSNTPYSSCCGQFIENNNPAPTAEKLMRSRYTAYTFNNNDYLQKTWHATTRPATLDLTQESQTEWLGLRICRTEAGGGNDASGSVEFIARYSNGGETAVIHEVSRFLKEDGRWYYVDGTLSQPSQNGACPCGSGKKFKRCCGK